MVCSVKGFRLHGFRVRIMPITRWVIEPGERVVGATRENLILPDLVSLFMKAPLG